MLLHSHLGLRNGTIAIPFGYIHLLGHCLIDYQVGIELMIVHRAILLQVVGVALNDHVLKQLAELVYRVDVVDTVWVDIQPRLLKGRRLFWRCVFIITICSRASVSAASGLMRDSGWCIHADYVENQGSVLALQPESELVHIFKVLRVVFISPQILGGRLEYELLVVKFVHLRISESDQLLFDPALIRGALLLLLLNVG